MVQKITNHTFITADSIIEFLEALEIYMWDHNPSLHIHLTVSGDEQDVDGFEKYYKEECSLCDNKGTGPDGTTYPNGRYQ